MESWFWRDGLHVKKWLNSPQMYSGHEMNMKVINKNQARSLYFIKPRTMQMQTVCAMSFSPHMYLFFNRMSCGYNWYKKGREKKKTAAAANSGAHSDKNRFYMKIYIVACDWVLCKLSDTV